MSCIMKNVSFHHRSQSCDAPASYVTLNVSSATKSWADLLCLLCGSGLSGCEIFQVGLSFVQIRKPFWGPFSGPLFGPCKQGAYCMLLLLCRGGIMLSLLRCSALISRSRTCSQRKLKGLEIHRSERSWLDAYWTKGSRKPRPVPSVAICRHLPLSRSKGFLEPLEALNTRKSGHTV